MVTPSSVAWREIYLRLATRRMYLLEEHLLLGALDGSPVAQPPLQRPQLAPKYPGCFFSRASSSVTAWSEQQRRRGGGPRVTPHGSRGSGTTVDVADEVVSRMSKFR